MTIEKFMKKTNVTKKKYALAWLEAGLIPGARLVDGVWDIPASARRPYRPRCKAGAKAKVIHTSMVRACQKWQHITHETYGMSREEFDACIHRLVRADLVEVHCRDGVTYYDPTTKSMAMEEAPSEKLQKFVVQCLGAVAEGTAKAWLTTQQSA